MKHPAACMDAVFDIDPEPGRPVIVAQAGPPPQESTSPPAGGLAEAHAGSVAGVGATRSA